MATRIKKSQKSYRRGGAKHYAALAKKSVDSRIKRHIEVEVLRDPNKASAVAPALPVRKRETDAGYDISTPNKVVIVPHGSVTVMTGIKVNCPAGYFFEIRGRSSLNKLVEVTDGLIDATYTGEVRVRMTNLTPETIEFNAGDRIAQLIFLPQIHVKFREVESFKVAEGDRGDAGFGSTGS